MFHWLIGYEVDFSPSSLLLLSHCQAPVLAAVARCLMENKAVYCWGSQCFLSVSALFGMLCCLPTCLPCCLPPGLGCCIPVSPLWALSPACFPSCLPPGLGCCVRLLWLVSQFVFHRQSGNKTTHTSYVISATVWGLPWCNVLISSRLHWHQTESFSCSNKGCWTPRAPNLLGRLALAPELAASCGFCDSWGNLDRGGTGSGE